MKMYEVKKLLLECNNEHVINKMFANLRESGSPQYKLMPFDKRKYIYERLAIGEPYT